MQAWGVGRSRWYQAILDSKVHGDNMGPPWVLSAPDGPHVGPMNLTIYQGCCFLALYTDVSCIQWIGHRDREEACPYCRKWWYQYGRSGGLSKITLMFYHLMVNYIAGFWVPLLIHVLNFNWNPGKLLILCTTGLSWSILTSVPWLAATSLS